MKRFALLVALVGMLCVPGMSVAGEKDDVAKLVALLQDQQARIQNLEQRVLAAEVWGAKMGGYRPPVAPISKKVVAANKVVTSQPTASEDTVVCTRMKKGPNGDWVPDVTYTEPAQVQYRISAGAGCPNGNCPNAAGLKFAISGGGCPNGNCPNAATSRRR